MLIVAAPAVPEDRAGGTSPIRRRFNNAPEAGSPHMVPGTDRFRFHGFASESERSEDNLAIRSGQTRPAINHFFDLQEQSGRLTLALRGLRYLSQTFLQPREPFQCQMELSEGVSDPDS